MTDTKKTKKQLIDELEQLRRQVNQGSGKDAAQSDETPSEPTGSDITRRTVLKVAWAAPVILSIPLHARTVSGQLAGAVPADCPTMSPTATPTMAAPTRTPTLLPTTAEPSPPPTPPTLPPTTPPKDTPTIAEVLGANPPTAFPTVALRASPAAAPAPRVQTALFKFDD